MGIEGVLVRAYLSIVLICQIALGRPRSNLYIPVPCLFFSLWRLIAYNITSPPSHFSCYLQQGRLIRSYLAMSLFISGLARLSLPCCEYQWKGKNQSVQSASIFSGYGRLPGAWPFSRINHPVHLQQSAGMLLILMDAFLRVCSYEQPLPPVRFQGMVVRPYPEILKNDESIPCFEKEQHCHLSWFLKGQLKMKPSNLNTPCFCPKNLLAYSP